MNTGTTIQLSATTNVVVVPQQTKSLSSVTLMRTVDKGDMVLAFIAELNQPLLLWGPNTSPTYSEISDWTQNEANQRIAQLVAAL